MTRYKLYTRKNESLASLLVLMIIGGILFTEMSSNNLSILALFVAITISIAVRRIRHGSQDDNFLRLDDDGVTYVSWGRTLNWRWSDLPAFEIHGSRKFWFAPLRDRRIGIGKHTEAWRHFRLRPTIRDDYDTPLDDIAATLNACRERALGGANGPASPEQA